MTLKERIENALKGVEDPATHLDVMRMRLIKDLSVDAGGKVRLTFHPPSPVCPMAFKMAHEIQKAVLQIEGVRELDVRVSGYARADELMEVLEQAQD